MNNVANNNFLGMCNSGLWCLAPEYTIGIQHIVDQYKAMSMTDRLKLEAFLNPVSPTNNTVQQGELSYQMVGNTMVYPIIGQLVPKINDPFIRYMGFISTLDIIADLEDIFSSNIASSIDRVIFYISGPGGVLTGIPELANLIYRIGKSVETIGFADNVMASAHYYIGSATNKLISTRSAIVGSIGVIREVTKFNRLGENTILFTEGEYKAAGHPAKSLDMREMLFFKELVSAAFAEMVADISKYRNKPKQEIIDTQGAFIQASMNEWFVDGMVNSFNELILQKQS